MTCIDRIIERHPWVAPLLMAVMALAVSTVDGWWL